MAVVDPVQRGGGVASPPLSPVAATPRATGGIVDPVQHGTSSIPSAAKVSGGKSKGGGGFFGSIGRAITGNLRGPSGGGVLGGLGRFASGAADFVNPIHTLTHTIPSLGMAAATDIAHLGELTVGRGPLARTLAPHLPSALATPQGPPPTGSIASQLQTALPLTGGIAHSVQQTGRYGAGAVQAVAGIGAGKEGRLGRGLQHETSKQFAADPFGSTLNVAGTAALIAPVLGAGAEAAGLEGTAAGLRGAGELGGRAMTAPFRPLGAAAEMGGGFARGLASPEEAGPVASRVAAARIPGAGVTVGEQAAKMAQVGETRDLLRGGIDQLKARQARVGMYAKETQRAAGGDQAVVEAAVRREAGLRPVDETRLAAAEHGINLERAPSDRVARLTAGQGSPAEEGRLVATADVLRRQAEERGAEEQAGVGRLAGPLPAEQFGMQPLERPVAEATDDPRMVAEEAANRLAAARAEAGIVTPGHPGFPNAVPPEQANIPQLTFASRLMARASGQAENQPMLQLAAEHGLQSPAQIPEYLAQTKAALGQTAEPEAVPELRAAHQAHSQAQADLAAAQQAAEANPMNAPGRTRPALLEAGTVAKAINDMADRVDQLHARQFSETGPFAPGLPTPGDDVRALTDGLPQTLAAMREAGIDPTHFTGPGPVKPGAGEGPRPSETLPRAAKLASEKQKVAGVLPTSAEDIARTESIRARQVVANQTAQLLVDKMAPSAAERGITIEGGNAPRGFVGYNPRSIFDKVPSGQVTEDTPLMPKAVFDTFRRTLGPDARGAAGKMWDSTIRGGKDIGVAMSPAYWAAVLVADSMKVGLLADAGPLAVIRSIPGAVEMLREHPDDPLAAQLAGRGLSAEQAATARVGEEAAPGGLLHRAAAPFWRATDYVQSVQRLSAALADVAKGASPEDAVADARRVAGVFDNLTHTEQNVRRVIPGYAFYKHISQLALRLPIDSPARMAWLGYLYHAVGEQKAPSFLNPAGVLGGLPSLAPPIRFGMELAGMHPTTNVRKLGGLTSPTAAGRGPASPLLHGAAAPGEIGYLGAQLLTPTRGALAAIQPNVPRYQTGEPLKTGTPYPGGRLAGVAYGLGLSTPTAAPKPASRGRGGSGRQARARR